MESNTQRAAKSDRTLRLPESSKRRARQKKAWSQDDILKKNIGKIISVRTVDGNYGRGVLLEVDKFTILYEQEVSGVEICLIYKSAIIAIGGLEV